MKHLLAYLFIVLGLLLSLNISQALEDSAEDALKNQLFNCWSIPLGLPKNKDLIVSIKLKLLKDGTVYGTEILDHEQMKNNYYKVLANSVLRAIYKCQPLKVPPTGYDKWKDLQLNFNPLEMLKG